MAEESSEPRGARRWWFVGVGALVVAGLVWAVVAGGFAGRPAAAGPVASVTTSPDQTTNQTTTPVPEPSVAPPTATGAPTVEPTRKPTSVKTDLKGKVTTAPGITASIVTIEAVTGEAKGPGEIAGPALRVTINVRNGSDKAINTELGLVNLYYGKDRNPAGTLSGPGATPFPAQIPAGGSGTGSSVFNVPSGERDRIRVEFSYSTDAPIVVFSGAA